MPLDCLAFRDFAAGEMPTVTAMRPTPARNPQAWLLLVLIVVAFAWAALLLPGQQAAARFQSSVLPTSPIYPAFQSGLPSATRAPSRTALPTAASTRTAVATRVPAATLPPTAAATASPSPSPSVVPEAQLTETAIAASFLPAPTLTSPDAPAAGALQAGSAAPLSAPPIPPARPTATPEAPAADTVELLAGGLRLVGYLWLACGSLAMIGLLAGAAWLLRRRSVSLK